MDDKLVRFFNKINFKEIDEFKSSSVTKVVINKKNDSWTVYIENNKVPNIEVVYNLIDICNKGIDDVSCINLVFDNKNNPQYQNLTNVY